MHWKRFWGIIIISVFAILLAELLIVRAFSDSEIDDMSPGIACPQELVDKADALWVIPDYNESSIAENGAWCEYMISMNKTIGLHGVHHSFNEFSYLRNESYLQKGIDDFEACFGKKPTMFKAPQLAISSENREIIESGGLVVKGRINQITHKVYHCEDTGMFPNRLIGMI